MKVEVSKLFSLKFASDWVANAHIGDGVYIQEIKLSGWFRDFCDQLQKTKAESYQDLLAFQRVQWHPYTHRFYVSVEGSESWNDEPVKRARELIYKATVLSRVVRPTPVALHGVMYLHELSDSPQKLILPSMDGGYYGTAYVDARYGDRPINLEDAEKMAEYWPALQYFYANYSKYKRIWSALKFFNDGYHLPHTNLRHIIFHAALESMVCTNRFNNRKQVTKRLPQLINITADRATAIYDLCVDVKHNAAPSLLFSQDIHSLDPRDDERHKAVLWLEDSLRELFSKAFESRNFADELADATVLEANYPV
ncbi:MAG TPA: hypothetical protein VK557_03460 [Pyrinomonadaceae bacterium]|nr:hypothetical protein [Pyrinomonadaceae bacterium]